jgi:serine/threonine-protein kinase
MGRVDLVLRRDGSFERFYAIKRLHAHLREDPEFEQMFLDEGRIAGLIRHPNVVSVLEVDTDEEGSFLLMDYVEGVPLSRFIREHSGRERPPLQLCLRVGIQIANGLHAAHTLTDSRGEFLHLVHRDISPQNILLGFDGLVRITDFGVARALGSSSQTAAGVLKGKLGYMSPEQISFQRPDFRSDLYSLGVVFYELLTAQRMYPAASQETIARAILAEPPPDPFDVRSDLPPALVELLFELLAKTPDARPESAKVVADRFEAILNELVPEEGNLDLASYMEQRYGLERSQLRDGITQRVRKLGHVDEASQEPAPIVVRKRVVTWAGLGLGLVAAIGAGMVSALVLPRRSTLNVAAPPPAMVQSVDETPAAPPPAAPMPPPIRSDDTGAIASASVPSPANPPRTTGRLPQGRAGAAPKTPPKMRAPAPVTSQPPAPAASSGSLFNRWQ